MTKDEAVAILLVEDNQGDVRLTIEALKEVGVRHTLAVARNGVEAFDYLHQRGAFAGATRPDIILLDLNLPKKDGREVLTELKANAEFRHIPVIVLTTSRADEDVHKAYDLHANCYITKPVDMNEFIDVVKAIDAFWFKVATLPQR